MKFHPKITSSPSPRTSRTFRTTSLNISLNLHSSQCWVLLKYIYDQTHRARNQNYSHLCRSFFSSTTTNPETSLKSLVYIFTTHSSPELHTSATTPKNSLQIQVSDSYIQQILFLVYSLTTRYFYTQTIPESTQTSQNAIRFPIYHPIARNASISDTLDQTNFFQPMPLKWP